MREVPSLRLATQHIEVLLKATQCLDPGAQCLPLEYYLPNHSWPKIPYSNLSPITHQGRIYPNRQGPWENNLMVTTFLVLSHDHKHGQDLCVPRTCRRGCPPTTTYVALLQAPPIVLTIEPIVMCISIAYSPISLRHVFFFFGYEIQAFDHEL